MPIENRFGDTVRRCQKCGWMEPMIRPLKLAADDPAESMRDYRDFLFQIGLSIDWDALKGGLSIEVVADALLRRIRPQLIECIKSRVREGS